MTRTDWFLVKLYGIQLKEDGGRSLFISCEENNHHSEGCLSLWRHPVGDVLFMRLYGVSTSLTRAIPFKYKVAENRRAFDYSNVEFSCEWYCLCLLWMGWLGGNIYRNSVTQGFLTYAAQMGVCGCCNMVPVSEERCESVFWYSKPNKRRRWEKFMLESGALKGKRVTNCSSCETQAKKLYKSKVDFPGELWRAPFPYPTLNES